MVVCFVLCLVLSLVLLLHLVLLLFFLFVCLMHVLFSMRSRYLLSLVVQLFCGPVIIAVRFGHHAIFYFTNLQ